MLMKNNQAYGVIKNIKVVGLSNESYCDAYKNNMSPIVMPRKKNIPLNPCLAASHI